MSGVQARWARDSLQGAYDDPKLEILAPDPGDIVDTEQAEELVLGHLGATVEQPFGPGVDVYKVGGKIFALIPTDGDPSTISLKCDPDFALELRAQFDSVGPGYHLNKRHWNTVVLDGDVPDEEIADMIDHSYRLIFAKLPSATRKSFS